MRRRAELLALALVAVACRAPAPVVTRAGAIEVSHAYAFAPVIGDEGSAYFTMTNTAARDDTLTGVSVVGGTAMLHGSQESGGVVRMTMLDVLPLPANATVALAVGKIHLMMTDLSPIPRPGDSLHLTLRFAHGGPAQVAVPVYRYGDSPEQ
ncbi:MAG TPA: copper chaperone PCu(A)C [Gemmatimonadales bacterium]|nr:copper chaperone PCu(A)C [Gemmatimonadales bacterium]